MLETGSNPALDSLSPTGFVLNSKSSPQLTGFCVLQVLPSALPPEEASPKEHPHPDPLRSRPSPTEGPSHMYVPCLPRVLLPGCRQPQLVLDTGAGGLWGTRGVQHRAVQQLYDAPTPWSPSERSADSPHSGWHEPCPMSGDCRRAEPNKQQCSLTTPLNPALPFVAVKNRGKSSCKWLWENHLARARKWNGAKEMGGVPRLGGGGRRL